MNPHTFYTLNMNRKWISIKKFLLFIFLNLFLANLSILHPLETPKNLWFSDVSRGYIWENWSEMGEAATRGLQLYYNRYSDTVVFL